MIAPAALVAQNAAPASNSAGPPPNSATEHAPRRPANPADVYASRKTDPYWINHDKQLMVDFGDLQHFAQADAALPPPAAGENRVVFLGDSITEGWNLKTAFPGKPYVNRGISGETSPQMLIRFRQDVINLHPKVVVILAGTNDIAGNTGPMTAEQTENNLRSMADLATANGIRPVLCSVTPAVDFWWAPGKNPAPKIAALNQWIQSYAARKGYVYVDFYSALKDAQGGYKPGLSRDGVHPGPGAHAIMNPLVEAGIQKALQQHPRHGR